MVEEASRDESCELTVDAVAQSKTAQGAVSASRIVGNDVENDDKMVDVFCNARILPVVNSSASSIVWATPQNIQMHARRQPKLKQPPFFRRSLRGDSLTMIGRMIRGNPTV